MPPSEYRSPPNERFDRPAAPANAESPWVWLRSGTNHPFIFKRMIRSVDPTARPGDIVNIYDKGNALLGRGLYNPHSNIALRVLTHGLQPLDESFWIATVDRAVQLRETLQLADITDAYRLVHAEGDGLSGLIVERYGPCLVLELFSLGMYQRANLLAAAITQRLGSPSSLDRPDDTFDQWRVILRADEKIQKLEGFQLSPDANADIAGEVVVREHGLRYRVDMTGGHKTGFFCDQRDNRLRFAKLCRGADVLDLCCYTGGFGLCAKAIGDAKDVISVDLDEDAIALAKKNANLNNVRIRHAHADAFIYLRQMIDSGRQFDAVVCDPPKFAMSRTALDEASRKYNDLNMLAMRATAPGGLLLTCSCSGLMSAHRFTDTIKASALRAGRKLQFIDHTGAGADHPVMANCPESEYLKAVWCRVL